MIFVTVGTQRPFDRMVRAVDGWAAKHGRTDVVAQIGEGQYEPKHIKWYAKLSADDSAELVNAASLIISEVGVGTVLGAMEKGTPILVMPRRISLGEDHDEHLLATTSHLKQMGLVEAVADEVELVDRLDLWEAQAKRDAVGRPAPSTQLMDMLKELIDRRGYALAGTGRAMDLEHVDA